MTRRPIVLTAFFLLMLLAMRLPRAAAHAGAAIALKKILVSFRGMHGISMHFICEKKLVVLKHPFISGGAIAIQQPDRVRFATNWPYRSCFILRGSRVYRRTENNHHWRTGKGSKQQVVQRIMRQFAGWSLGQFGDISRDYHVLAGKGLSAAAPPPPTPRAASWVRRNHFPKKLQIFTLIPKSRSVRHAVDAIRLGFLPRGHQLRLISMHFADGSKSIYWLGDIRINPRFPHDEFRPKGQP